MNNIQKPSSDNHPCPVTRDYIEKTDGNRMIHEEFLMDEENRRAVVAFKLKRGIPLDNDDLPIPGFETEEDEGVPLRPL